MSPTVHPRTPLWTALGSRLQHSRDAYAERRTLERELSSYTSQSDLNELHAILDRYPDGQAAPIRRILTRRPA